MSDPTTTPAEAREAAALAGPWVAVMYDSHRFLCDLDEATAADAGIVEIAVVRGTAAPRGDRMPGSYQVHDRLYRVEDVTEIDDDDPAGDVTARWTQAQAVARALNQLTAAPTDVDPAVAARVRAIAAAELVAKAAEVQALIDDPATPAEVMSGLIDIAEGIWQAIRIVHEPTWRRQYETDLRCILAGDPELEHLVDQPVQHENAIKMIKVRDFPRNDESLRPMVSWSLDDDHKISFCRDSDDDSGPWVCYLGLTDGEDLYGEVDPNEIAYFGRLLVTMVGESRQRPSSVGGLRPPPGRAYLATVGQLQRTINNILGSHGAVLRSRDVDELQRQSARIDAERAALTPAGITVATADLDTLTATVLETLGWPDDRHTDGDEPELRGVQWDAARDLVDVVLTKLGIQVPADREPTSGWSCRPFVIDRHAAAEVASALVNGLKATDPGQASQ